MSEDLQESPFPKLMARLDEILALPKHPWGRKGFRMEDCDRAFDYEYRGGGRVSDTNPFAGKAGHPGFYDLLVQIAELHARKNSDYAAGDPLSNLRQCEAFGVTPFQGVLVRLSDKWSRITNLAAKEGRNEGAAVRDESIEDTLMDMAVYSLLAIVLRREEKA